MEARRCLEGSVPGEQASRLDACPLATYRGAVWRRRWRGIPPGFMCDFGGNSGGAVSPWCQPSHPPGHDCHSRSWRYTIEGNRRFHGTIRIYGPGEANPHDYEHRTLTTTLHPFAGGPLAWQGSRAGQPCLVPPSSANPGVRISRTGRPSFSLTSSDEPLAETEGGTTGADAVTPT